MDWRRHEPWWLAILAIVLVIASAVVLAIPYPDRYRRAPGVGRLGQALRLYLDAQAKPTANGTNAPGDSR
jgi:hypothetical protein